MTVRGQCRACLAVGGTPAANRPRAKVHFAPAARLNGWELGVFEETPQALPHTMNAVDRSRLIARIFTRPVMEDIARRGTAGHVTRELKALGVTPVKSPAVVADLFDASLQEIGSSYRCEYVYKAAIASRIVFGRHSPRTSSLAIELGVAGSIADAAVFNGTSTAYEIKTEFDSHRRLNTQTLDYRRAFDRVYIVTHPDMAERYATLVDERVGVLSLSDKNSLCEVRAAVGDLSHIEPATVFRMLRRQEYVDAVRHHFGPQPPLPNGRVAQHHAALFCRLSGAQAHDVLVAAMRSRTTDTHTVAFVSALPASLRALAYATPLSRPQRERVLTALAAPL